ncbi:proline-rich protein 14 isoform X2 [Hyla sarda]|uniref:proline-rich protein 14 isoform X2 n=1 Tax=Hyla sarda TaxID=327740 RepID=UPI0024C29CED|nr:proline-rich protein 14 isoform X2 [Hyla sarda]
MPAERPEFPRAPSPNDFLKTPPQPLTGVRHDMTSPRGFLSTLHRASPMERERRRILSVELRDIGHEVEHLQVQMPEFEGRWSSTAVCEDRGHRTSPMDPSSPGIAPPPTIMPISTEDSALTLCRPPLMSPPKEESGWGLLPLFNSVRSKLESFAEIFLTPVKSQRGLRNSEAGAGKTHQPECSVPRDPVQPYTPSPECHHLSNVSSVWAAEDNPPSQRTPPTLRLQTETSSILCRPPLQRHLSCPLLPVIQHKRRHSVDTAEPPTEPCSCRRRRHSLGSVEECRSLMPFSLSCLRKENHPSVLKLSPFQPNGEGSSAVLCLDQDREQGHSGAEHQVTRESIPDSDYKTPENLSRSKENKVSNIQIRKRAQRQEGNLTPLGLPKRVRLQKEDFSLEEIYTNKNYRTPTEKRKFETIFEEPIMKGDTLILTSQRPLRRIMVFKEGGAAPRKRKKKGKAAGRTRRWTDTGTGENVNYELLLQHKLKQLDAALQEDPPGL